MKISRKVVVGHWKNDVVHQSIGEWCRAAVGWHDSQRLKIARFGDNMRDVAVTEGDKVAAQIQFGYSVNGFGMGDLKEYLDEVSEEDIDVLTGVYIDSYTISDDLIENGKPASSLREAAKIEIGLRSFMVAGGFKALTDTFENLHGLNQLPGIAVQRMMNDGYGFGAEGDWKTAALVRTMKVMAKDLPGGNSFMEDYTYHFQPNDELVLGSHMLEICPSIAADKPSCEVHPLGIGGKKDPVRLVFDSRSGPALNASMIDLGDHFRLLVNTVDSIAPKKTLPNLPVARVLWKPHPNLEVAAAAWILAGGGHHTCFSQNISINHLEDYAEMAGIELITITQETAIRDFRKNLH